MAKGKKTGGKNFGQGFDPRRNYNGAPILPLEIKKSRELGLVEFIRTLNEVIYLTVDELNAKIKNPNTTMLEQMICSVVKHATNRGDPIRANFIIDRLIGKTKETIDLSLNDAREIKSLTDEELAAKAKSLISMEGKNGTSNRNNSNEDRDAIEAEYRES